MTKDQAFEGYILSKHIEQLNKFLEVLSKASSIKIEVDCEKHGKGKSVGENDYTYCLRPVDIEFSKIQYNIKGILSIKLDELNKRLEHL